jgi:formylglycine-generating enzyme
MGSNSGSDDEQRAHAVTLSASYISTYEVSQTQWREITGTDPSHFTGDDRPVEKVNWYDAVEFCNA